MASRAIGQNSRTHIRLGAGVPSLCNTHIRSHTRLTPTQDSTDSEMKEIAQEPPIGLLERTVTLRPDLSLPLAGE